MDHKEAETNKPTFYKLKVTGPRTATMHVTNAAAVNQPQPTTDDYNPTLRALLETNAELQQTLATTKQSNRSRGRNRGLGASSRLAVYDALLERLRALKSQFDTSYDPLIQMLVKHMAAVQPAPAAPPAPPPAQPAPPLQPAEAAPQPPLPPPQEPEIEQQPTHAIQTPAATSKGKQSAPTTIASSSTTTSSQQQQNTPATRSAATSATHSISGASEDPVLKVLPQMYHGKYNQLRAYLEKNPSLLRTNNTGNLIVNGEPIEGSTYIDVIRSLYIWRRTAEEMPSGTLRAIKALQAAGVPSSVFSASVARNVYDGHGIMKMGAHAPQDSDEDEAAFESPNEDPGNTGADRQQSGKGVRSTTDMRWPGRPPKVLRLYS